MKRSLLFFILCCALVLLLYAAVQADPPETVRGKAFSDPSRIQEMPEDWYHQPISYDPEIGTADLAITLDQHLYPALTDLIQHYAREQGLRINVSEGTCGISAGKLARKAVDIGGFCCPPGETDRLPGLAFHTIGIIPIAFLVHPSNPIDTITLKQARAIFQGKMYRWSELSDGQGRPGPNLKIKAVGRLHCKIRPGHWRLLLDNEDSFSLQLREVGTIPDMISLIATNPGAIGYEVMMMVERHGTAGMVKVLKIDGIAPSTLHVLSGTYPVYRTLTVTTWEEERIKSPHAHDLVNYVLDRAEQIDSRFGIVPASRLRKAGWRFRGDELVGEPGRPLTGGKQ